MNEVIQKAQHYEVEIIDMGEGGEGIGKIQDFTVFVPNVLVGDQVEICLTKVKKNYGFGKLVRIITPSIYRIEVRCDKEAICGGCQFQSLDYQKQLEWKRQKVENCLKRIGKLENIEVEPTLGMGTPYHYRNKAQYPIRLVDGKVEIGFFEAKSKKVVPVTDCLIQHPINKKIIECVKDFLNEYKISIYDDVTHKGLVRHLMIKTGYKAQDVMVCLVINGKTMPHSKAFVECLQAISEIKSIVLNHHTDKTPVILGKECTVLYGSETITEQIGELKFKVSPLAFFQVNPSQTEVLYQKALEYAELSGDEIVWDAYCGIGSISLFLAQKAKKVYGVEIIPEAIENARENAKLNDLNNTEFYAGKAEEVIPDLYKQGIIADTIVVDPPRKGCDEKLLETLKAMVPQRIVYVSCDPATLARDLAYLTKEAGYQVEKVQPVDMFPHTSHVECIVSLKK
ncbi:MAG: 23S rRNA (uracil(1939)-C(5))-methyltransferase RlmD [Cellulosilyticum sp.]|nr:23S rRNA (uracil(1939)-C(5))-methyltransferase RlmD [Cellulosilyticum sp.]